MWYAKLFYVKETVCGTRKGGEALLRGNVLRGVVDVGRGRQTGLVEEWLHRYRGAAGSSKCRGLATKPGAYVGMKMRRVWGQKEKRKI